MILKAWEFMEEILLLDRCDECDCPIGPDWKYKDYSNRSIVVCPQCRTEYKEQSNPLTAIAGGHIPAERKV